MEGKNKGREFGGREKAKAFHSLMVLFSTDASFSIL